MARALPKAVEAVVQAVQKNRIVASALQRALAENGLQVVDLAIQFTIGFVFVSGRVRSPADSAQVEEILRMDPRVRTVRNRLQVA